MFAITHLEVPSRLESERLPHRPSKDISDTSAYELVLLNPPEQPSILGHSSSDGQFSRMRVIFVILGIDLELRFELFDEICL